MDIYSPLLDSPIPEKQYFENLPERLKTRNWIKGYKKYLNKFKNIKSHPGLIHRQKTNINRQLYEEINDTDEIELFDINNTTSASAETTPLLETATIGTTATTATNTAPIAIGIGTGLIGGTIGILTSQVDSKHNTKNKDDPIITLKKHKYIGPGNNAYRKDKPIDTDDEIAKKHDILYSEAKTEEDIRKADKEYLIDSAKDLITNKNIHSAIGIAGKKIYK